MSAATWRTSIIVAAVLAFVPVGCAAHARPIPRAAATTGWRFIGVPHVDYSFLYAASCTGRTFCVAVGEQALVHPINGQRSQALIVMRGRRGWRRVTRKFPGYSLQHVSCSSANFCMSVGSGNVVWNGRRWRAIAGHGSSLNALSCASNRFCVGAGAFPVGLYKERAQLEVWRAGRGWRVIDIRADGGRVESGLGGVSCPSSHFCLAVGNADNGHPLALRFDGSSWHRVPVAAPGGFGAVDCLNSRDCLVLGSTPERWNGNRFIRLPEPTRSNGDPVPLVAISCAGQADCTAVTRGFGTLYGPGHHPTIEHWNGRRFHREATPLRKNLNTVYGISCVPRRCVIPGSADSDPNPWLLIGTVSSG